MDKRDAIAVLEEIALLLEVKGENPFKTRAYTNAARALADMDEDLGDLVATGELVKRKGFGKALVDKLTEMVETGRLEYLEHLRAEFPETLPDLLDIPGLGPKKVKLFYEKLGIADLDSLEAACRDGRVADLPGCGPKTAMNILAGIERRREYARFFLYVRARDAADDILAALRDVPGVARAEAAGSTRRGKEVTKDVDLLVASDDPGPLMAAFVELPGVRDVLGRGETKSTIVLDDGLQVDLRVVPPAGFACALHHFTGSRDHNVAMRQRALERGMKLSEWGLTCGEGTLPCPDEAAIFRHLDLDYIPPELREDRGEIEAAAVGELPELVRPEDYRGVLHCHSTASDGACSIDDLVVFAHSLGHQYLAITDHSASDIQAHGLDAERLLAQVDEIRRLRDSGLLPRGFRLFSGIEVNIHADGTLDYADSEVLPEVDFAIASVHGAFSQDEATMTARIVRAIEHPSVRILGHPTGRLLLRRDAYAVDLDKVIDAAAANDVAIELNCHPLRLDMDWRWWRRARDRGVLCSVNPDAHVLEHFDYIDLGIRFARKGWLRREDILNCLPGDAVAAFFAR